MQRFVYADNAGTTALSKTALEAMMPYLTEFYGNPSSIYSLGRKSKTAIETARQKIAAAIGAKAEEIYSELGRRGVEVVLDDRNERPGVKFKDADLIGYPIRIVVGPRRLETGQVEVKLRKSKEARMVDIAAVPDLVTSMIRDEMAALTPQ